MTLLLFQRCDGKPAGDPIALPRGRRRLSSIARRHADHSRPFLVTVHRKKHPLAVTDFSVRMRKQWRNTTVGPLDRVIIVYLPRGGGGGASGNNRAAKGATIGLLVATVALAALGQFWAIGAINGALSLAATSAVGSTIWAAASVVAIGGAGYLFSRATQAKANKTADDRPVYGVSGGGNLPRPGDRIPIVYGRCWNTPDLSQPDYTIYDGDDQVLFKRMTVGCGKYAIKTIRINNSVMWTAAGGIQAPFTTTEIEIIPPGGSSTLVPGQVLTSQAVTGNEVPRADENPAYAGPFDFGSGAPNQTWIQIDYSLPEGVYAVGTGKYEGKRFPTTWGVHVEYAPCDEDGNPTGAWATLFHDFEHDALAERPIRRSKFVLIASGAGRYTFRAQNTGGPAEVDGSKIVNTVRWEALRAHIAETILRPGVTEIAMKIRSGKGSGITAFGNIEVESSKILPVWNGAAWLEQETDKAVWAAFDILTNPLHGADLPNSSVDLPTFLHYAASLTQYDTFSGVIRGPVSVYEALSTVLGTMRASPLRLGSVWTLIRDEQKLVRRHVVSRRQILRDSTGQNFNLDLSDGSADVIVEWFANGDPRRQREYRVTFGTVTNVPRRMMATGVTKAEHAIHLATWTAACAYWRRKRRSVTTELAGRLIKPNDKAMIDVWYFDRIDAVGVWERDGLNLHTDRDAIELPASPYVTLRARDGREWGPVAVTQPTPGVLALNADDVAFAEDQTGLSLDDVINTDSQAPTSVVIGTVTEQQTAWLVRSIDFAGETNVSIEAVHDAPQVWTALGEPIIAPPDPPTTGLVTEGALQIAYLNARAVQRGGVMFMDWTAGRARVPCDYVVTLSYDNWATSEDVYRGPASSGSYAIRETTGFIKARCYGISPNGVKSAVVETQFTPTRPVISGELLDIRVNVTDLVAKFRADLDWYSNLNGDVLATLWNTGLTAVSADGKASASIKRIEQVSATETRARAILAEQVTAQVGAVQAQITTVSDALAEQALAVSTLTTTVSAVSGTVAGLSATVITQAQSIVDLQNNKASVAYATTIEAKANSALAGVSAATAGGQFDMVAVAGPGGASSRIRARAWTDLAGLKVDAGWMIDIIGGVGRFSVFANQFVVVDPNGDNPFAPLFYSGGQWFLNGNLTINGNTIINGTLTAAKIVSGAMSKSANAARADQMLAPGSGGTIGIGGGAWGDYTTLALAPEYDARVELKLEYETQVIISGNASGIGEVRVIRRKGGVDTQLGRSYLQFLGVDQRFPTVRDEPGVGSVTYVIQYRMYEGGPGSNGSYIGRINYGSIVALVLER